ncbi:MAG: DUF1460 domain-containing protein [Leadbetterella sp.]|nr:DUF1460 domain-containing protein [Leadbetterella sp.]
MSAQEPALKILRTPAKDKLNKTVVNVAEQFLGKPYVAATLEKTPEALVINLEEFDCFTLVENVLALSLAKHSPEAGLDIYREYLQLLRYRDGVIDGYASRMHYFTDWARQAVHNGILEDITGEVGEVQEKPITFMSENRRLYPALATDDKALAEVMEAEKALNENSFYYVPKAKFSEVEAFIEEGDIIAFTSVVKGLDVNHEGFAVRKGGKLHLLHASLDEKKVIISKETLQQYLDRIKKHTGIMIFRPAR